MIKKNQKLIVSIIVFGFFFIYVTLLNFNRQDISYDRIWVFHMLQKIANGDLIYTDMNIITGPVFYTVGGLFFLIFGSTFITYDILSGLVFGVLATLMYNVVKEVNKSDNKIINMLMLIVIFYFSKYMSYGNYNLFAIIFIMSAMYIEIRKVKDKGGKFSNFLIGAFLSLAFFSKQTIGGMAIIATGLVSLIDGILIKKKNPMKEILEKMVGFFAVFIPIIIAMLIAGNFQDYINLCFGSILEFGGNNMYFYKVSMYVTIMTGILGSSVFICKLRKDDTEFLIITLYSLAFIFFMFPILNFYHLTTSTLFIWFLVIKLLNICLENNNENAFKLFVTIVLVLFFASMYSITKESESAVSENAIKIELYEIVISLVDRIVMCGLGIALIKENEKIAEKTIIGCAIFAIVAFGIVYAYGLKGNIVPPGLKIYANHGFKNEMLEKISKVIEYIELKESEGYKVYVVSWDASEYYAPMNRNNNEYDLLLSGNLGYKGTEKILNEVKEMRNVIILKNKKEFWQEPKEIMEYITVNFEKIDEIEDLEVYKN